MAHGHSQGQRQRPGQQECPDWRPWQCPRIWFLSISAFHHSNCGPIWGESDFAQFNPYRQRLTLKVSPRSGRWIDSTTQLIIFPSKGEWYSNEGTNERENQNQFSTHETIISRPHCCYRSGRKGNNSTPFHAAQSSWPKTCFSEWVGHSWGRKWKERKKERKGKGK